MLGLLGRSVNSKAKVKSLLFSLQNRKQVASTQLLSGNVQYCEYSTNNYKYQNPTHQGLHHHHSHIFPSSITQSRLFSTSSTHSESNNSTSPNVNNQKVLLVDGTPLIVRAYHGTPPLSTASGFPTNAVVTYLKSLLNILQSEHYDYIGVFFDSGKPSFRKNISADYKANRKPTDENLRKQFPVCKLLTEKMGLKVISMDGFEADDLIATMARQAKVEGKSVVIVSSDKDLHCLVDEKVVMLDPMGKKTLAMDDIIEKYSLPPKLIPDFLSLVGDAADNIKGVKGIGKKKAVDLLDKFGSVEGILNSISQISDKKTREAIENNVDDLKLSMELVELDEHINMDHRLNDLKIDEEILDFSENSDFIKAIGEYELNSISKMIEKQSKKKPSSTEKAEKKTSKKKEAVELVALTTEMSSSDVAKLKNNYSSENQIGKVTKDSEYNIILNEKELDNLIEEIKSHKYVTISTEICSLGLHDPVLAGISFCINSGSASYVPFFKGENVNFLESIEKLSKSTMMHKIKHEIMENDQILKIGHNMKYHIKNMAHYGVSIKNFDDVMVMSYVLNCGKHGHEMDEIVENVLGIDPKTYLIPEKEVLGIGKKKVSLLQADIVAVVHYACQHADVTRQAYEKLKAELDRCQKLTVFYDTIEKPLVETLAGIEMKGVFMDEAFLKRLEVEYQQKIKIAGNKIREEAGYPPVEDISIPESEIDEVQTEDAEFNINSNRQLGQTIFEKLGLGAKYKKKGKAGDYVLNAEVLEKLSLEGHNIAKYILEYRALTKLYSTYIHGLIQHINPYTKRIHTTFQNALTVTGRLSSTSPNIQNIPARTKEGKQIRRCFIAPSEDYIIMKVDYSQVELRILAHIANINQLKDAFRNDKDVHSITASQVFKIPVEQIDKATRNKAKAINFGIIYGMSEFGLAKRIGVTTEEAKTFIEKYFQQYPGIKQYMTRTIEFCRKHGYVNTLYHRRCWIPGINEETRTKTSFAERTSINTPIQGTSADITKIAMNSLHKAFLEKGLKTRMIIQVHDEIVFEVPKDEVEIVQPLIKELMEGACFKNDTKFSVPLTVEATIDNKWLPDE